MATQQSMTTCREGSITPGALVLCPNAALCHQVKLVADSLTDGSGSPLLQTAHVSSSSPPPFHVPDILVSTPASLINVTEASHYGPEWTRGGILARYTQIYIQYTHTHRHSYIDACAHTVPGACTPLHVHTHIHTGTYVQHHNNARINVYTLLDINLLVAIQRHYIANTSRAYADLNAEHHCFFLL